MQYETNQFLLTPLYELYQTQSQVNYSLINLLI